MREIITQLKARWESTKAKKREINPTGYRLTHKPMTKDIHRFFSLLGASEVV
jgi:hypothetical protein